MYTSRFRSHASVYDGPTSVSRNVLDDNSKLLTNYEKSSPIIILRIVNENKFIVFVKLYNIHIICILVDFKQVL